MRTIKFRAWDQDFNKWIDEKSIIINRGKPIAIMHQTTDIDIQEALKLSGKLINPNWILMQFTGLFDKNKKEIYEGDIIKFDTLNVKDSKEERIKIAPVVYTDFGTRFVAETEWGNLQFYEDAYTEVVGNIYENPELLEVKT